MPDRSTDEASRARARAEVEALEQQFGQECGPWDRGVDPKPEVPKHQPWNTHCPGSVAYEVMGGYKPRRW